MWFATREGIGVMRTAALIQLLDWGWQGCLGVPKHPRDQRLTAYIFIYLFIWSVRLTAVTAAVRAALPPIPHRRLQWP